MPQAWRLILAAALLAACAPAIAQEPAPSAPLPACDQALIDAGRAIGVLSIVTGQQDAGLTFLAQEQANYCASHCQGGHQLFDGQFRANCGRFPGLRSIVAESWPGQDVRASAAECFNSWRQSGGHWAIANGRCRSWGFAMRKGRNGVWYGAGYCSD